MSCAIEPFSMAHQWRKAFCAIIEKRLRQKRWRRSCAIAPFSDGASMAQAAAALRWRSACLAARFAALVPERRQAQPQPSEDGALRRRAPTE
jgi:hypothetical protein